MPSPVGPDITVGVLLSSSFWLEPGGATTAIPAVSRAFICAGIQIGRRGSVRSYLVDADIMQCLELQDVQIIKSVRVIDEGDMIT